MASSVFSLHENNSAGLVSTQCRRNHARMNTSLRSSQCFTLYKCVFHTGNPDINFDNSCTFLCNVPLFCVYTSSEWRCNSYKTLHSVSMSYKTLEPPNKRLLELRPPLEKERLAITLDYLKARSYYWSTDTVRWSKHRHLLHFVSAYIVKHQWYLCFDGKGTP